MVHGIFKRVVPYTNRKIIELDLSRHYNVMQALRHIIDGREDSRFNNTTALSDLALDPHLNKIFSNWYAIENTLLYSEDEVTNNGK